MMINNNIYHLYKIKDKKKLNKEPKQLLDKR